MKRSFRHLLFTTVALSILCGSAMAQFANRAEVLTAIENKRSELQALEKQFLAPAEEDRTVYADFLRQADTGLIRLLPRETYSKGTALTITGGGAYYSFTRL